MRDGQEARIIRLEEWRHQVDRDAARVIAEIRELRCNVADARQQFGAEAARVLEILSDHERKLDAILEAVTHKQENPP